MPSNYVILCRPLLLLPSIFPRIRVFSSVSVLHIRWPKYWSFNFSISPSNEYSGLISFRIDWFDPYCPRDSQESSPTPQFKSINSSVLSFLYGPTLTSIHANSKSISLTIYMDLCQQSYVSAFSYAVCVCHSFSSKEQASFNFMAAVTVSSDFAPQENKICHCFQYYPFYLP